MADQNSPLQQAQEAFEHYKAQKSYAAPYNTGYQHPCPSCGRCPHCGRGGYGWTPYSGPQWTCKTATVVPLTVGYTSSN